MASGVIPSTCSCTRADSIMSSRPTGQIDRHYSQITDVSYIKLEEKLRKKTSSCFRLWDNFICTSSSNSCRVLLPPSSLTKKVYTSRDVMLYCTCQCSNFSENFWAPSTDGSKGLRSGQTTHQRFHLLLRARQGHLPQEHHGHTAVWGKPFRTICSSDSMQNVFQRLCTSVSRCMWCQWMSIKLQARHLVKLQVGI